MFRMLIQGLGLAAFLLFASLGLAIPIEFAVPYYMEPQSKHDVHLKVIQRALALQNYEVTPIYLPTGKIAHQLSAEKVAGGYIEDNASYQQFFSSNAYVYHLTPIAISLKSKDLNIESTEDLNQYRVIAFDSAKEILGDFYRSLTSTHENYTEQSNQASQVKLLFLKKTDVIVLADSIFEYYKTMIPKGYSQMEVVYHHFLKGKQTTVQPVFREKRVKEAFEMGIQQLRASGELSKLLEKS